MSNIYIQEPPTEGKVLLVTSAGDFDIELWSKEAPKACRNFVQLCLEGYYDNTLFHRVVPSFIAQGGDPTGTGTGGESIYGKPFRDEFHTRLRFVRRGLVAMANGGPNDNSSQFFFTLGPSPELANKHTIFGKVAGNTLYNLPRFEEGEIGKDDRPIFPHKIQRTQVLSNPFNDLTPRVKIQNEVKSEKRKKGREGTKNFKLLSFGDEAEEDETEVEAVTKRLASSGNSAHDIAHDPTLSASTGGIKGEAAADNAALQKIRQKLQKGVAEAPLPPIPDITPPLPVKAFEDEKGTEKTRQMADMRAEIRKLKQDLTGKGKKVEVLPVEELEEGESQTMHEYKMERAKYEAERLKLPKKGHSREDLTLAMLSKFTAKVQKVAVEGEVKDDGQKDDDENDDSWLKHRLLFDASNVVAKDASTKDDTWHDISDPRNTLAKRRRGEGSEGEGRRQGRVHK